MGGTTVWILPAASSATLTAARGFALSPRNRASPEKQRFVHLRPHLQIPPIRPVPARVVLAARADSQP